MESTVRCPMPQIATVILLFHMGLGCCWHHARTYSPGCHASHAAVAEACACGDHLHRQEGPPREDGGHDPHGHACCGSRCSYVRHEQTAEQQGESVWAFAMHHVIDSLGDLRVLPRATDALAEHFRGHFGAPSRVHLLFRVLLI